MLLHYTVVVSILVQRSPLAATKLMNGFKLIRLHFHHIGAVDYEVELSTNISVKGITLNSSHNTKILSPSFIRQST